RPRARRDRRDLDRRQLVDPADGQVLAARREGGEVLALEQAAHRGAGLEPPEVTVDRQPGGRVEAVRRPAAAARGARPAVRVLRRLRALRPERAVLTVGTV